MTVACDESRPIVELIAIFAMPSLLTSGELLTVLLLAGEGDCSSI